MVFLIFLESLFGEEFLDEVVDVVGDFGAFLAVELHIAEVFQEFGQEWFCRADLLTDALGDGIGDFVLIDAHVELRRQVQVFRKGT